ncbi:MAG: PQQ-dependent sugar dehydrogenase [Cyclobacteriaceae bacterium]|nr:PQQ-dependent sugar dehydrogenase [Cyclobacteriaceae bacterium]
MSGTIEKIDQPNLPISQNLADARGKIYRINKDGSLPGDNPDLGPEAVPGIYATGIRAAQGITLHPKTGEIWFSEHGTMQGDEVNILEAGANYGWPIVTTGKYRDDSYQPPKIEATFKDPQWFWTHTVAPTGLTFYFGSAFPQWQGDLIVPGLSRGSLWRLEIQGNTIKSTQELFVDDRARLRKAVVSPQGKLYLLTDEDNGKLILVDNKPQE